jgi:hypothetical protein
MTGQTRRSLLRVALGTPFVAVAGCLGDDDDNEGTTDGNGLLGGQNGETPTDTPNVTATSVEKDTETQTETPTKTESTTGTETRTETPTETDPPTGDEAFYRWLPTPIGDGPVEGFGFTYWNSKDLRTASDTLGEDYSDSGEGLIPWLDEPIDEQLLLTVESVAKNPTYSVTEPSQIYTGEFDKETVADRIENDETYDWDSKSEYDNKILFTDEGRTDNPGITITVGPTELLSVVDVLDVEEPTITERLLDTNAGRIPLVQAISEDVGTIFQLLDGGTVVEFAYGDAYSASGEDAPEGSVHSYDITPETTERQFIFVFQNGDAIREDRLTEISNGLAEDGYTDVSQNVDGKFAIISGTRPTEEVGNLDTVF